MRLHDKIAIITGAGSGIGRATATLFAREGASLVINDIDASSLDHLKTALGSVPCRAVPGDISKEPTSVALAAETMSAFGRIDILVNNAGTSSTGDFESVSDELWQSDFDLKLFAAIRLSRLAIPHMKKQGGGRIVNITTIGAKQPRARSMPTTVTRAAGLALTKALSKEFAKDNILVNTVSLGLVRAGQHERKAEKAGVPVEKIYADMARDIPLGRVGKPEEAAAVIAFLASGAASYVTGASINLDGGASGVL